MGKGVQKSILFVQFPWRMSFVRLGGVYRYASEKGWRVQVAEYGRSTESIPKMLAFWNPDGCIVEGGCLEEKGFDISAFDEVPTVYCDSARSGRKGKLPGVMQDSSDAAVLAARELLSLAFDDYAFVGYVKPRTWSDQRREIFCRLMGEKGKTCHVFDPRSGATVDEIIARLGTFLSALPKPCGIFAANDLVADLVLHCCRQNGFAVPESIAVVGVDNDKLICENSSPTLTSVAPDFEMSGYLAAKLLGEFMENPRKKSEIVTFGSVGIVRRASTRRFARRDEPVRKAVEMIRTEACGGLAARDVVRAIGGSRRNAEMRFRALAGKSIGEAIQEARVARAKELLRERSVQIDSIFVKCGYATNGSLRKAFRRATGVSMREWREGALA